MATDNKQHFRQTLDRISNGTIVTQEELHLLRTQLGALNETEQQQLSTAIDEYSRTHKDKLKQDVQTASALLDLRQQLSEQAGLSTADHAKNLASEYVFKPFTNPDNSVGHKVVHGIAVAVAALGLYRLAKWAIGKKNDSFLGKTFKVLGLSALAAGAITFFGSNLEARQTPPPIEPPASKPKPKPQPKTKRKPTPPAETKPEEPVEEAPAETPAGDKPLWIDDERLEGKDLLKGSTELCVGNIAAGFEQRDINGEEEVLLNVSGKTYRMSGGMGLLKYSQYLKVARADGGELYIYGSMGPTGPSSTGYIESEELRRVIKLLDASDKPKTSITVSYFDADRTSRNRLKKSLNIDFEVVRDA